MSPRNIIYIVLSNSRYVKTLEENSSRAPLKKTGFDIREVAHVIEKFCPELSSRPSKFRLMFVSVHGGSCPIDPTSITEGEKDPIVKKLMSCPVFIETIRSTRRIEEMRSDETAAVILIGGHGSLADFPISTDLQYHLSTVWSNGGVIGAISQGVSGLINVPIKNTSKFLVSGKTMTCSSSEEEKSSGFMNELSYCLEEKLKSRGAILKESSPWKSNVIVDGKLISAQNHCSSCDFATKLESILSSL